MSAPVRHPATDVSLFTLGGTDFITAVESGSIHFEVKEEDASGVADLYEYPWATKGKWHVEIEAFAETIAALMPHVGASLTFALNTGAGAYSGQVLVPTGSHDFKRDSLQKQKVTLRGQGAPTLS